MKDNNSFYNYDRQYVKKNDTSCGEYKRNKTDCDAECGQCERHCKDICINNNPTITICVNGSSDCPTETEPFLSSYMEALGQGQTVPRNGEIVFDVDSIDSVGGNIELSPSGTTFTINQTGLYHVEWNLNLAADTTSAVVGIMENGEPASGSATVTGGNFSSGTVIQVDTVPFTLSLYNYNGEITIENVAPYEDSAASIRIVRFADGPDE